MSDNQANVDDRFRLNPAGAIDRIRRTPEQEADYIQRANEHEEHAAKMRRRSSLKELQSQLGPRYAPSRVALEKYEVYDARQKPILARIMALNIGELVKAGGNLVFFGTVGTGKDHLLAYLLYCAIGADLTCGYVNGRELFARVRGSMGNDAKESERQIISDLVRYDVLAISDPLPASGQATDWQRDILYRLFDRRYTAMRSTWVSANVSKVEDADNSFTEPVWDRIQHGAEVFLCDWPSFRERAVAK